MGLEPYQTIDSLPEQELDEFHERLGYDAFVLVLVCVVVLWITSMTIAHGMFDNLLAFSFGFVALCLILKLCWPEYKVEKDFHDEVVSASFYRKGNGGFLSYDGKDYPLDDFEILDGKLHTLYYLLSRTIKDKKRTEEKIFYVKSQDIFIKRTCWTWLSDQRRSYRVISWIFFGADIVGVLSMVIGAIIIAVL